MVCAGQGRQLLRPDPALGNAIIPHGAEVVAVAMEYFPKGSLRDCMQR